jgi:hypothetical protein
MKKKWMQKKSLGYISSKQQNKEESCKGVAIGEPECKTYFT